MNWISNVVRPKIRSFLNRRDTPENLWIKCPETGQLVFYKDVEANQFVIPGSNYHMRIGAVSRLKHLFDDGEFDTELRCAAVAVRDFTGRLIGALGISGPIWRLSIQALQSRAKVVEEAAARLSAEFGALGPDAPGKSTRR